MNMEFTEEQLSDEIAATRFALIELTLFLDPATHRRFNHSPSTVTS